MQRLQDIQRRTNPFRGPMLEGTKVESSSESVDVVSRAEPLSPRPVESSEPELERLDPRPPRLFDRELRAMTGHEEQLVEEFCDRRERGGPPNTAVLCNELLARCLVAPGRDPDTERGRIAELTVAERDLAVILLRRRSYGDRVEALIDCPACHEANETRFDLAEWSLELDPIPTRIHVRLGELGEAELRLPTAGDQAELLAVERGSNARRRTWMLARVLLSLDTRRGPFLPEQLHELPVALRRGLARGLARCLPDLDLSLDVRCCACGHEFVSPFDIESFFLPS